MPDLARLESLADRREAWIGGAKEATRMLRQEALRLHSAGVQKTVVCRVAGISRMTLDAWLREEDSR